ncbi:MAG: hypothetical protein Tsb0016_05350 [Sphingomonadales bacterium]
MKAKTALLPLLLLAGAIAAPATAVAQDGEARAIRDYQRYCASCHGMSGRGDGPVAPMLMTQPSDLTQIAARHEGEFPATRVAFIIDGRGDILAHGPRDMPVWGEVLSSDATGGPKSGLAQARIQGLVDYLRSLQEPADQ